MACINRLASVDEGGSGVGGEGGEGEGYRNCKEYDNPMVCCMNTIRFHSLPRKTHRIID